MVGGPGCLAAAEASSNPSGLVVGIDRDLNAVSACAERHAGWVLTAAADARWLPFATASFDVITTFCVLVYVPDKPGAIAEMHRVLRPGGRLALLEPVHEPRLRYTDPAPDLPEFEPAHRDLVAEQQRLLSEHGRVLAGFSADSRAPPLSRIGRIPSNPAQKSWWSAAVQEVVDPGSSLS